MAGVARASTESEMNSDTREFKAALRRRIRSELKNLSLVERIAASAQACSRLQQERLWQEAQYLLLYAPLPEELDIWPLLREALARDKVVALPRFESDQGVYSPCQVADIGRDLQRGQFGISEPRKECPVVPLNRLDFVLVPGVAFNLDGRRIGRGGGFYDRLLASVCGIKCGVAFDPQVVSEVPVEPHDVRLDYLLTPTRWIRF